MTDLFLGIGIIVFTVFFVTDIYSLKKETKKHEIIWTTIGLTLSFLIVALYLLVLFAGGK